MARSKKRGSRFLCLAVVFFLGIILFSFAIDAAPPSSCPAIPLVVGDAREEAWALRMQEKLAERGVPVRITPEPGYVPVSSRRAAPLRQLTEPERRMIGFSDKTGLSVDFKNAWNRAFAGQDVKVKRYSDYFTGKYAGDRKYLGDAVLAEAQPAFVARVDEIVDEFNALPFAGRQNRVGEFVQRVDDAIQGDAMPAQRPITMQPMPLPIQPVSHAPAGVVGTNRALLSRAIDRKAMQNPYIQQGLDGLSTRLTCVPVPK